MGENVPGRAAVKIDFERPGIPHAAIVLQPDLFKDGEKYICALRRDAEFPVLGYGATPEQAVQDWDNHVHERIKHATEDDRLASFIVARLSKWGHEQEATHELMKKEKTSHGPGVGGLKESGIKNDDLPSIQHSSNESSVDGSDFR